MEGFVLRSLSCSRSGEAISELLQLHDKIHIRANPLASLLDHIISLLDGYARVFVEPVCDYQARRSTDAALTVHKDSFPGLDTLVNHFYDIVQ